MGGYTHGTGDGDALLLAAADSRETLGSVLSLIPAPQAHSGPHVLAWTAVRALAVGLAAVEY